MTALARKGGSSTAFQPALNTAEFAASDSA